MIFFSDTMSRKMHHETMSEPKRQNTAIEHCSINSLSALQNVPEKHAA